MKSKTILTMSILYAVLSFFGCKQVRSKPENINMSDKSTFYQFLEANPNAKVKSIDGTEFDYRQLKGKKVLIVNTASECGYTPQYEELEKLYQAYKDKLIIIGFPANNFGGQEPGTNEEIKEFCKSKYSVTFPMFEKISVAGDDMAPIYKWLTSKDLNGWNDQQPKWNFNKYLLDEEGNLVKYYSSAVKPMSDEIVSMVK
ncbi:MAG TPA: glutathione peroxidase [Ignavibacteria bacterium]|nr:glutathione peroxidase [Ignavibacteria bacterium]HRF66337.1 glutathione peroxidase [Ignavibacteria bacterium]HRJ04315.1 glutathione peroxidase [Ignavibacteria bacterium]